VITRSTGILKNFTTFGGVLTADESDFSLPLAVVFPQI